MSIPLAPKLARKVTWTFIENKFELVEMVIEWGTMATRSGRSTCGIVLSYLISLFKYLIQFKYS